MATFNKFNSFVEAVAEKVHNLGIDCGGKRSRGNEYSAIEPPGRPGRWRTGTTWRPPRMRGGTTWTTGAR